MAKTLTAIQTLVRFHARDDSIVLTTDPGLAVANAIYRATASALPWSEFRKTVNLSAATATGTTAYSWAFSTTAVFTDVKGVEVETTATSEVFNLLYVPDTEWDWNVAAKSANSIPVYYKRINEGGTNKVELRPAPSYSTGVIRVIGIVQPTALTATASTAFLSEVVDDALAHMIAASFAIRDGFTDLASLNAQRATGILQRLFDKEQVTLETISQIAGVQVQK